MRTFALFAVLFAMAEKLFQNIAMATNHLRFCRVYYSHQEGQHSPDLKQIQNLNAAGCAVFYVQKTITKRRFSL